MSTTKKVIAGVTTAGASVLLVNSVLSAIASKSIKEAIFPIIGGLVALSAIKYSVNELYTPTINRITELED